MRGEGALPVAVLSALAALAALVALVAALASRTRAAPSADGERPRGAPGVRLTMRELHRQGGVPAGWQPRVPPGDAAAGRATFAALGCPSCHRVAGEAFSQRMPSGPGPELTGMGSHHPPAYFAEAVLDPDAVVLEGAGWTDHDGRSTMPSYPDMTVRQLGDVVAYLTSLRGDPHAAGHHATASTEVDRGMESVGDTGLPEPAIGAAGRAFLAQTYDLPAERRAAFEQWFASRGTAHFAEVAGLLAVDTYVDLERPAQPLTTVLSFRDEAALRTCLADPASVELWGELDGFVGPPRHRALDRPAIYRAPALSLDVAS